MRQSRPLIVLTLSALVLVTVALYGLVPTSTASPPSTHSVILATTSTTNPAFDTYVSSWVPSSPYCGDNELRAATQTGPDSGYYYERSYLGFNLNDIPSNAIVDSAYLYAYCNTANPGSGRTVYLRAVTTYWQCPSWSGRPGSTSTSSTSAGIYGPGWYNWNVTNLVQARVGKSHNTSPNYGFELKSSESTSVYSKIFDSNQGSNKPYLRVDYHLPTATPTSTATQTRTPTRTATRTKIPHSPTPTTVPSQTSTATRTATRTTTLTSTATPTLTATPTSTATTANTRTRTPTRTAEPATATSTPTATRTATLVDTAIPSSTPTATLAPSPKSAGITLDKRLAATSRMPVTLGNEVVYELVVQNTSTVAIAHIPLSDDYDPLCIEFVTASVQPDNVDSASGLIEWDDITSTEPSGQLEPGESIAIQVRLLVHGCDLADLVLNCATVRDALRDDGGPVLDVRDCELVEIISEPEINVSVQALDPIVCLGDLVRLRVTVENAGDAPVGALELGTVHDPAYLRPLAGGLWQDAGPGRTESGPIYHGYDTGLPGWSVTYIAEFEAVASTDASACTFWALADGIESSRAEDADAVLIQTDTGPCEGNAVANGDLESDLDRWTVAPDGLVRISNDSYEGENALLLGILSGERDERRVDTAAQIIGVPGDAASATLSYWYRVTAEDWDPRDNSFSVIVRDLPTGQIDQVLGPIVHTGAWRYASHDVSGYIGRRVELGFVATNSGDGVGTLGAVVDDVQICTSACGAPIGLTPPDPDDPIHAPGGETAPDYAPGGMPDFDMAPYAGLADGPVAALNALWWLDSLADAGDHPYPEIADTHDLVVAQGAWDDHDPRNVAPMVDLLSGYLSTDQPTQPEPTRNGPGTSVDEMVAGLQQYIADAGLADAYTVYRPTSVSRSLIASMVDSGYGVLVNLEFYETVGRERCRAGSHWVTMAGASSLADNRLAISDPGFDGAVEGRAGEVVPAEGGGVPGDGTTHNDAAQASHDLYAISMSGDRMTVESYLLPDTGISAPVDLEPPISAYYGGNDHRHTRLEHLCGAVYGGGTMETVIYDLVCIIPNESDTVDLQLLPEEQTIYAGREVIGGLYLTSLSQGVEAFQAYLNYDPDYLRVIPLFEGRAFSAVGPFVEEQNDHDATRGHMNLVMSDLPERDPVTGSIELGMFKFETLQPTGPEGTLVTFSFGGDRDTSVFADGELVLASAHAGMTIVIEESAGMHGILQLQGRGEPPSPMHVVRLNGGLSDALTSDRHSFWVTTTQDALCDVSGVRPGNQDITVRGPHTLHNRVENWPFAAGMTSTVRLGELVSGDVYGDDVVDSYDVTLLQGAFGTSPGDEDWDIRADLNDDGEVDLDDYWLLNDAYGMSGPILIDGTTGEPVGLGAGLGATTEIASTQTRPAGARPSSGDVMLGFDPSQSTCQVGDTFTIDLMMDTGSSVVDTLDISVSYPKGLLEVVDAGGTPSGVVETGAALTAVLANKVDTDQGLIRVAGLSPGETLSGEVLLATLRFEAKGPFATERLRFSMFEPETQVWYRGENVLSNVATCSLSAEGGAILRLPMIER